MSEGSPDTKDLQGDAGANQSPRRRRIDHESVKDAIKREFLDNLYSMQGKFPGSATPNDYYQALAYTVRNRMLNRWVSTEAAYTEKAARTVAYLSAEFLLGAHLVNNLVNLGILNEVRTAVSELGLDFEMLVHQEEEPGLGNGGLGRLAACFIDSLATLKLPAIGYGIRYEYGIFFQTIVDGAQVEKTDKWLRYGNPWEMQRAEWAVEVKLHGHTEQFTDERGRLRVRWVPGKTVVGVPYDSPILGYRVNTVNTLRLWKAEATESFDFSVFNRGDYVGAVSQKVTSENLSKVLYPNDETEQGKQLRLEQQYFFVSCSLQDMLRTLKVQGLPVERFNEKFTVQLNDTHPSIGVAELMRLLLDDYSMSWEAAWKVTTATFGYTNHTLLPEALEHWPVDMFGRSLPRLLEIIEEINARFLQEVRIIDLGDESRIERLSIISAPNENGERFVRMAHLACVGSYAVNGVAALHSELLKQYLLHDFYTLYPARFHNVTNGVTPRRWVVESNPRLTELITATIGDKWICDLEQLQALVPYADDPGFRDQWHAIKRANKQDFAVLAQHLVGVNIDPDTLYDVQVKRIHEYKRQHLAVLHIIALYHRLKSQQSADIEPRTFIFGGKAAPGYRMAKLIIKLINSVGEVINSDPAVRGLLRIIFVPNFSVTSGEAIYPAADLSEQISTAGKEASGTGNMKFAMNGALTIGTMDGANIEIRAAVGEENFFLFGMHADEVARLLRDNYRPRDVYESNAELRAVIDLIAQGFFSKGDTELFKPLVDSLLESDPYCVLADYGAYSDCQSRVRATWKDQTAWTRMSILNSARSGYFSSDRSIREYNERIWKVAKVDVPLLSPRASQLGFIH